MELDEMLKQEVEPTLPSEEVPQINLQEGTKVESTSGNIYMLKESTGLNDIYFKNDYEKELVADLKLLEQVKARIEAKKDEIKKFIEENDLASFKTNLLQVKYTSATTTTTIDTTKLKKEMPEIAAKYSKVGTRSSSLSFELLDMPVIAKDMFQL